MAGNYHRINEPGTTSKPISLEFQSLLSGLLSVSRSYRELAAVLTGVGVFAGAFTLGTLLTLPNSDFPFPDKLDVVRELLAWSFVMFSSCLFLAISVSLISRRENPEIVLEPLKRAVIEGELYLMGLFLITGFFLLNGLLIQMNQRVAGAVGFGLLGACTLWFMVSIALDRRGYFGRRFPTSIYQIALNAALEAWKQAALKKSPDAGAQPHHSGEAILLSTESTDASASGDCGPEMTSMEGMVARTVAVVVARVAAVALLEIQNHDGAKFTDEDKLIQTASIVVESTAHEITNLVTELSGRTPIKESVLKEMIYAATQNGIRLIIDEANQFASWSIANSVMRAIKWARQEAETKIKTANDSEKRPVVKGAEKDLERMDEKEGQNQSKDVEAYAKSTARVYKTALGTEKVKQRFMDVYKVEMEASVRGTVAERGNWDLVFLSAIVCVVIAELVCLTSVLLSA